MIPPNTDRPVRDGLLPKPPAAFARLDIRKRPLPQRFGGGGSEERAGAGAYGCATGAVRAP